MVANLSAHKRGWDDRWEEFSDWADKGMHYVHALRLMVDEDTQAFNRIMDAFGLPKNTPEEKYARKSAIQEATRQATLVPFKVMELSYAAMEVLEAMTAIGNPNSVSDAGVGALAARSAVLGASLNVRINAKDLEDKAFVDDILGRTEEIVNLAVKKEAKILEIVSAKLG